MASDRLIETSGLISHCVVSLFAGLPQKYNNLYFKLEELHTRKAVIAHYILH